MATYKPRKPGDIRGGQKRFITGETMGGGGGIGTKGSQTKAHKKPKGTSPSFNELHAKVNSPTVGKVQRSKNYKRIKASTERIKKAHKNRDYLGTKIEYHKVIRYDKPYHIPKEWITK